MMRVYFNDQLAGLLQRVGTTHTSFIYDAGYLVSSNPALSMTLPKLSEPITALGLLPYFDNLVAEGWLKHLQVKQLGVSSEDRYALLGHYGHDLIGCVSVVIDKPVTLKPTKQLALDAQYALAAKFSLSGVQPKLLVVKDGRHYRPKVLTEQSTHIAKLPSPQFPDLIENEYIATKVFNTFVDASQQAVIDFVKIKDVDKPCLLIQRFDRKNNLRQHFEEMNQCLGKLSIEKYDGTYADMSMFMQQHSQFVPLQRAELFKRICLFILLGNTDAHFKNFAFMLEDNHYLLSPGYDVVASALYPDFQTFAMPLTSGMNAKLIKHIQASQVRHLGKAFGLNSDMVIKVVRDIEHHLNKAFTVLDKLTINTKIEDALKTFMEKRWKQLFEKIGSWL